MECVPEGPGCLLEGNQPSFGEHAVVLLLADIDVVLSEAEHAEDKLCKLSSGGEDGNGASLMACHPAKRCSQGVLASLKCRSSHAQGTGNPVGSEPIAALLNRLTPSREAHDKVGDSWLEVLRPLLTE